MAFTIFPKKPKIMARDLLYVSNGNFLPRHSRMPPSMEITFV